MKVCSEPQIKNTKIFHVLEMVTNQSSPLLIDRLQVKNIITKMLLTIILLLINNVKNM